MTIMNMDLLFEIETITKKQYKCSKVDDDDLFVSIYDINEIIQDLIKECKKKEVKHGIFYRIFSRWFLWGFFISIGCWWR